MLIKEDLLGPCLNLHFCNFFGCVCAWIVQEDYADKSAGIDIIPVGMKADGSFDMVW